MDYCQHPDNIHRPTTPSSTATRNTTTAARQPQCAERAAESSTHRRLRRRDPAGTLATVSLGYLDPRSVSQGMKKVAIVQSNYIPWKGYFDMIATVDELILYDDMAC